MSSSHTPDFTDSESDDGLGPEYVEALQKIPDDIYNSACVVRGEDESRPLHGTPDVYLLRRSQLIARRVIAGKWKTEQRGQMYLAMRRHFVGTTARGSRTLTPLPNEKRTKTKPAAAETKTRQEGNRIPADRPRKENSSAANTSELSVSMAGPGKEREHPELENIYAFGGLHHLFAENSGAVTSLRYGNNNADLLAWSSLDGTISIANVKTAPKVFRVLRGHSKGVLDFSWSASNDYIASVGDDGAVRMWEVESGKLLRSIPNASSQNFIVIHPINPNVYAVGKAQSVDLINMSTGLVLCSVAMPSAPRCVAFDDGGNFMFVGDATGYVYTVAFRNINVSSKFTIKHRLQLCGTSSGITSLAFKRIWTRGSSKALVLANCLDSQMRLLAMMEPPCSDKDLGQLRETHRFAIVQKKHDLRSVFCPLLSGSRGACIVSGSEDGNVYIFDVTVSRNKSCINKLQGHSSPVISVDWNYDETVLATGDKDGIVLLWKRQQTTNTSQGIVD